eukprot:10833441-Lingulodinium_polyedra.AAC.1
MSAAALQEQQLDHFHNLMTDKAFRASAHIDPLRQLAWSCPHPTSEGMMKALESWHVWSPEVPTMPDWAHSVAKRRAHFADTVLKVLGDEEEEAPKYFKFIYAIQKPCYLALCPLTYQPGVVQQVEVGSHNWHSIDQTRFSWHCNFAEMASAEALLGVSIKKIWVITRSYFQHDMVVSSEMQQQPLEKFLDKYPEEEKAEEHKEKKRRVKDEDYEKL